MPQTSQRPMLGLAIDVLIGCMLGLSVPLGAQVFGVLALLAMGVARLRLRSTGSALSVHLTVVLLSATLGAQRYGVTGPSARAHADADGARVHLRAQIDAEPILAAVHSPYAHEWTFSARAHALSYDEGLTWQPLSGRVHVRFFTSHGVLAPSFGDRWQLAGRLFADPFAPQGLPRLNAAAHVSTFRSGGHGNPVLAACIAGRREAAALLAHELADFPQVVSVMHSLLLGYRGHLPFEVRQTFRETGTYHVFAISGLHLGILAGLIVFILNSQCIPRTRWIYVLAPLLIAFTMATGMRPSAVRACTMAIVYFTAAAIGRRPDPLSALGLAASLILLHDPGQLLDTGFLFSFTVVLGLILFYPIFYRLLMRPFTDRDGAQEGIDLPRHTWRRKRARRLLQPLISLTAASSAAWIWSMPISAHLFERVTPIGLAANFVVIPITFGIVLCGALSIVVGMFLPLVAGIFNHAAAVLIHALLSSVAGLSRVPGAYLDVSMPITSAIACYALLFLLYALWVRHRCPNTQNGVAPPEHLT